MKKAAVTTEKFNSNINQGIAESIERKMERATTNKEPITAISKMIYTEKGSGVDPSTDIRTDKWEIARIAQDKVNANRIAQQQAYIKGDGDGQNKTDNAPDATNE